MRKVSGIMWDQKALMNRSLNQTLKEVRDASNAFGRELEQTEKRLKELQDIVDIYKGMMKRIFQMERFFKEFASDANRVEKEHDDLQNANPVCGVDRSEVPGSDWSKTIPNERRMGSVVEKDESRAEGED
jgi:hypothetical protein